MLSLETIKERIADMLSYSLEGEIHENMEQYLSDIQADYDEFYLLNVPGEDWKKRYDELKEKYISRFMGDTTQTIDTTISEPVRTEEGETDETIITYDDLFEEEEE